MKITLLGILIVAVMLGLISMIPAHATEVTLTGPDEEITGDSKLCIYEGHGTTKYYEVRKAQPCPFAKTFDVDDDE